MIEAVIGTPARLAEILRSSGCSQDFIREQTTREHPAAISYVGRGWEVIVLFRLREDLGFDEIADDLQTACILSHEALHIVLCRVGEGEASGKLDTLGALDVHFGGLAKELPRRLRLNLNGRKVLEPRPASRFTSPTFRPTLATRRSP